MGTVIAAGHHCIPIAHIHGGETTEGAIDESIRHSITKFSHLHFTSCDEYYKRVIQLGENPNFVFNVGALGVENILTQKLLSREELGNDIFFTKGKYALVTFHPVTLEKNTAEHQLKEMLEAFLLFDDLKFIITKSNADAGGKIINKIIDQYCCEYPNKFYSEFSLGMIRYLSSMKYADLVIGNSSSGIIESPSFKVPTINIGDRQKGRKQAISIINCKPIKREIYEAMKLGLSQQFRNKLVDMSSPYGFGKTSQRMIDIIKLNIKSNKIDLKKKFYDINFKP
ncbi:UDP-N-acetylglucosamine 2-epimerase [Allocoprobacillus halotolerans]|uniref:UDP-N-acetylglucosamine 2-epimerase n=1 Tax=Allocoprobacillus halotolerans TaxID=2944914 RepID=A0ABY5HYG3_9FIRM|nr:UDP-N-acetylglucosamine 2-epimerase [Allocoprobacillus halotolerans]